MAQEEQFNFDTWSADIGLSELTVKKLKKEQCDNFKGIKQLQLKDVMEMSLAIGQRNLLLEAIREINRRPQGPPENGEEGHVIPDEGTQNDIQDQQNALADAGKNLDMLMGQIKMNGAQSQVPVSSTATLAAADPRTILTMKSNSCKAVHITQFLPEQTKTRLRDRKKKYVLGSGEGGDNVVILKDNKHPYSGITIGEWGAANCRLMAYLLSTGYLKAEDVDYYLAYTTQIYEWYETYLWEAILDFDHTYRERQAEHQFKWGVIPPNMQINLQGQPRPRSSGTSGTNQRSASNRNRQSASRAEGEPLQECRLFKNNKGNCPYGDKCKFAHTPLTTPKEGE